MEPGIHLTVFTATPLSRYNQYPLHKIMGREMNKEVKTIVAAILTASVVMATAAQAAGDKEAGKEKAIPCQICHGKGGRSTNPLYPVLAGQHAQYIIKQLKALN